METGEEEGGEVAERGVGGEGVERGREMARRRDGAVDEGERGEGGEGAERKGKRREGGGGGAVGEGERDDVAKRMGGVAGGGVVVRGGIGAGIVRGEAEKVESFELFRVERGGGRWRLDGRERWGDGVGDWEEDDDHDHESDVLLDFELHF